MSCWTQKDSVMLYVHLRLYTVTILNQIQHGYQNILSHFKSISIIVNIYYLANECDEFLRLHMCIECDTNNCHLPY